MTYRETLTQSAQTIASGYGASAIARPNMTPTKGVYRSNGRQHLADCECKRCNPERYAHPVSCACDQCHGTTAASAYRPIGGPSDRVTPRGGATGSESTERDDETTETVDGDDGTAHDWNAGHQFVTVKGASALATWAPIGHGAKGDAIGTIGGESTGKRCKCQLCAPKARGRAKVRTNAHRERYGASEHWTPDGGTVQRYTVDRVTLARYLSDRLASRRFATTADMGRPMTTHYRETADSVRILGAIGADAQRPNMARRERIPTYLQGVNGIGHRLATVGNGIAYSDGASGPMVTETVAPIRQASAVPLHYFALGTVETLAKDGRTERKRSGRKSRAERIESAATAVTETVTDGFSASADETAALLALAQA